MGTPPEQILANATPRKAPLTVQTIMKVLNISKQKYQDISVVVELEMEKNHLLGRNLDTDRAKLQLDYILTDIKARFAQVFENTPESFNKPCLVALAQKCNYNSKRRKKENGVVETEKESIDGPVFLPMCQPIRGQRGEGSDARKSLQLLSDLIPACNFIPTGRPTTVTLDQVEISRLVQAMHEDIAYHAATEGIMYSPKTGEALQIENEHEARNIIAECYARDDGPLTFVLDSSHPGRSSSAVDTVYQQRLNSDRAEPSGATKYDHESIPNPKPGDCTILLRSAGHSGKEAAQPLTDGEKSLTLLEKALESRKRKLWPPAADTAGKGKRRKASPQRKMAIEALLNRT